MLKRLLNRSEQTAYSQLQEVCTRRSAKLYTKVRLADVLPIENSGLPGLLFEFALQAHYDFVITGHDDLPRLAIEIDGPSHDLPIQAERDAKKNELSHRFGLFLLRIRASEISNGLHQDELITRRVEQWLDRQEAVSRPGMVSAFQRGTAHRAGIAAEPPCPLCGSRMVEKRGRYGKFLSCVRFPRCRGAINLARMAGYVRLQADANQGAPPISPTSGAASRGADDAASQFRDVRTGPGFIEQSNQGPVVISDDPLRGAPEPDPCEYWAAVAAKSAYQPLKSTYRALKATYRAFKSAYRALPDWIEAIFWGLGISAALFVMAAAVVLIWFAMQ